MDCRATFPAATAPFWRVNKEGIGLRGQQLTWWDFRQWDAEERERFFQHCRATHYNGARGLAPVSFWGL